MSPRAFSLIEAMVVVAILGVIAALALPSLLPEVHKAQLDGAAEGTANFISRVRSEAMRSKRCTRIRFPTVNTMIAERWNTFDCEAAGAPQIQPAGGEQIKFDSFQADSPSVQFALTTAPAATATEIRFRPNGRVFSNDITAGTAAPVLTNDDAIVTVTHQKLQGGGATARRILVDGNGLICALKRGVVPVGPILFVLERDGADVNKRGYVMYEVMIGGALIALLLATLMSQIADARTKNVVAGRDAIAAMLVQQKMATQRARGFANVGTGCATEAVVANQVGGYERVCVAGAAVAETINGIAVSYKDLSVTVNYKTSMSTAPRTITAVTRVYE